MIQHYKSYEFDVKYEPFAGSHFVPRASKDTLNHGGVGVLQFDYRSNSFKIATGIDEAKFILDNIKQINLIGNNNCAE